MGPFAMLVPVFGMVSSMLLLGEAMTWWKVAAGVLVIGGLVMATFATLFFVPVIYSVLRRKDPESVDPLENG